MRRILLLFLNLSIDAADQFRRKVRHYIKRNNNYLIIHLQTYPEVAAETNKITLTTNILENR